MNKNIILGIIVLVLVGAVGYFVFVRKLEVPSATPTPSPTAPEQEQSITQPTSPPATPLEEQPTTQPEKQSLSTNETLSLGNCIIREGRESFFIPLFSNDPDKFRFDVFTFKFKEGLDARLRNGKFVSLCGADFSSLNKILSENPKLIPKRLFSRSEEELEQEYKTAELNNPDIADLNLWYSLQWDGNTDPQKLLNLMNLIKQFLFIEGVEAVPIPTPANLP